MTASHSWITRYFFPLKGDFRQNHYILHFENPDDPEELMNKFYALIVEFAEEIGGHSRTPGVVERDRFVIQGPKGFAIIEIAPAYTEEEFDEINQGKVKETLDLTVWESMFKAELPKEDTDERHFDQRQEKAQQD